MEWTWAELMTFHEGQDKNQATALLSNGWSLSHLFLWCFTSSWSALAPRHLGQISNSNFISHHSIPSNQRPNKPTRHPGTISKIHTSPRLGQKTSPRLQPLQIELSPGMRHGQILFPPHSNALPRRRPCNHHRWIRKPLLPTEEWSNPHYDG